MKSISLSLDFETLNWEFTVFRKTLYRDKREPVPVPSILANLEAC